MKYLAIMLIYCCSTLLDNGDIKVKSNIEYVVADGKDEVPIEVIEEKKSKSVGDFIDVTKKAVLEVGSRVIEGIKEDIENSFSITDNKIFFNKSGDYDIRALYHGKTSNDIVIRARKDINYSVHISKNAKFDLKLVDPMSSSKNSIKNVLFEVEGKKVDNKSIEDLINSNGEASIIREIKIDCYLRNSKIGVINLFIHDLELIINENIITNVEDPLSFRMIRNKIEDPNCNYNLILKNNESYNIRDLKKLKQKLIDSGKTKTSKISKYKIYAELIIDNEDHKIITNYVTLNLLKKWEEEKNYITNDIRIKEFDQIYKNFKDVKIFSKDLEIKSIEEYLKDRLGVYNFKFILKGREIGNLKLNLIPKLDIRLDEESLTIEKDSVRMGYIPTDINVRSDIRKHVYLVDINNKDIKDKNLGYFQIIGNNDNSNLEVIYIIDELQSKINLIHFEKPANKSIEAFAGEDIIIEGFETNFEDLKFFLLDEKFKSKNYTYVRTYIDANNNVLLYKDENNKIYLTTLIADNNQNIIVKIGNTPFCNINLNISNRLITDKNISEWSGINNPSNNCFANSAFKFLASFDLINDYFSLNLNEIKNDSYKISMINRLKGVINRIRSSGNNSINEIINSIFVTKFLKSGSWTIKNQINKTQNFSKGQHEVSELINAIIDLFPNINLNEKWPNRISFKRFKSSNIKYFNNYNNDVGENINENLPFNFCLTDQDYKLTGNNSREAIEVGLKNILSDEFNNDLKIIEDQEESLKTFVFIKKDSNGKRSLARRLVFDSIEDLIEQYKIIYSDDESNIKVALSSKKILDLDISLDKIPKPKGINEKPITFEWIKDNTDKNELKTAIEEGQEILEKKYYLSLKNQEYNTNFIIYKQRDKYILSLGVVTGVDMKTKIESMPKLISVNFKRKTKDINNIDIIVSGNELMLENIELEGRNYKLRSAVIHLGSTSGGHYYIYIRDDEKGWYKHNDDTVSKQVKKLPECHYTCLVYEEDLK